MTGERGEGGTHELAGVHLERTDVDAGGDLHDGPELEARDAHHLFNPRSGRRGCTCLSILVGRCGPQLGGERQRDGHPQGLTPLQDAGLKLAAPARIKCELFCLRVELKEGRRGRERRVSAERDFLPSATLHLLAAHDFGSKPPQTVTRDGSVGVLGHDERCLGHVEVGGERAVVLVVGPAGVVRLEEYDRSLVARVRGRRKRVHGVERQGLGHLGSSERARDARGEL